VLKEFLLETRFQLDATNSQLQKLTERLNEMGAPQPDGFPSSHGAIARVTSPSINLNGNLPGHGHGGMPPQREPSNLTSSIYTRKLRAGIPQEPSAVYSSGNQTQQGYLGQQQYPYQHPNPAQASAHRRFSSLGNKGYASFGTSQNVSAGANAFEAFRKEVTDNGSAGRLPSPGAPFRPGVCRIQRSMIPSNPVDSPAPVDEALETLITQILPDEVHIAYRHALTCYMIRIIRRATGAKVYELGSVGLHCFLPEDTVRLSVFVSRGQENIWHNRLSDRLLALSTSTAEDMGGKDESFVESEGEADEHSMFTVGNVVVGPDPTSGSCKVLCQVANINFEIQANLREDLLMLLFLEEVDRLIGQNHLFKRALVLIRCWWTYESRAHMQGATAESIPESAMTVMILSVFNKNHRVIHHPLHALCYFLLEFTSFDWENFAATIHGPMQRIGGQVDMATVGSDELLQPELIRKYQDVLVHEEREAVAVDAPATGSPSAAPPPPPPTTSPNVRVGAESMSFLFTACPQLYALI